MLNKRIVGRRTGIKQSPLQNKAFELYADGRISEALAAANDILGFSRPDVSVLNLAAVCHMQLGSHEKAILCWQQAIRIHPGAAELHNNLGILLQQQNRQEEAEAAFRQAIDCQPENSNFQYNFGYFLQQQNRLEEAEAAYRQAICVQPDYADAHSSLGNLLLGQHRIEEAEAAFRQAIHIQPDHAKAHYNLGGLLHAGDRFEDAEAAYREALAFDPTMSAAIHMLSALRGEKSPCPPERYVRDLFNSYADTFEHNLVQNLRYNMPLILRQAVEQVVGESPVFSRVVDMGCGTGLLGQEFRPICGHLLGIDLAERMVELSGKKAIYDELVHGDIVATLEQKPVGIDLFLASDVFVYVGELSSLFQTIRRKAAAGALFAFSVEHLETGDYALRPSGRYAHSLEYIQALADECKFSIILFGTSGLRMDKNGMIPGGVYILRCGDERSTCVNEVG
ncbi:MAG: tetratricopeptide repeat protein [Magnetococcales bacterium]|nr:tetratricopeptide repeat protein [Magnetococcales bacterium]